MFHLVKKVSVLGVAGIALAGCSNMQMGSEQAKTVATGSAAGTATDNVNSQLEKCSASLGTLAIAEDTQASWYSVLSGQMKLGSTVPVLKLIIQQSNCFVVVERGKAMGNIMGERALAESGEMRQGSRFQKGQMVAADYTMSPSVTFSNQNAGGLGGALGGRIGGVGALLGGSLNYKEASTVLTLIDNRSSVQLAAAEGSARNMDLGAVGGIIGSAAGGGLGGGGRVGGGQRRSHAALQRAGRAARHPGRLFQYRGRQGDRGRVHGCLQQHGQGRAQLQGTGSEGRSWHWWSTRVPGWQYARQPGSRQARGGCQDDDIDDIHKEDNHQEGHYDQGHHDHEVVS